MGFRVLTSSCVAQTRRHRTVISYHYWDLSSASHMQVLLQEILDTHVPSFVIRYAGEEHRRCPAEDNRRHNLTAWKVPANEVAAPRYLICVTTWTARAIRPNLPQSALRKHQEVLHHRRSVFES